MTYSFIRWIIEFFGKTGGLAGLALAVLFLITYVLILKIKFNKLSRKHIIILVILFMLPTFVIAVLIIDRTLPKTVPVLIGTETPDSLKDFTITGLEAIRLAEMLEDSTNHRFTLDSDPDFTISFTYSGVLVPSESTSNYLYYGGHLVAKINDSDRYEFEHLKLNTRCLYEPGSPKIELEMSLADDIKSLVNTEYATIVNKLKTDMR